MSNACGIGYCSKGWSTQEVDKCIADARADWNGLCAYQSGSKIEDPDEIMRLTCCESGCQMVAHNYANWNGLCVYQRTR